MAFEKKEVSNIAKLFSIQRVLDGALNGYFTSDRVIKAENELIKFRELVIYFNDREMLVFATCEDLLRKFFEKQMGDM